MGTLTIRAHHAESAKAVYNLPKDAITQMLIKMEYVSTENDPFVELINNFVDLFDNPKQRFKLKVGGLDFICEKCPKFKRRECNPEKPKKIVGEAFLTADYSDPSNDEKILKKYGLEVERVEEEIFTSEELKYLMDF